MHNRDIHAVMRILQDEGKHLKMPVVTEFSARKRDPYQILVSTILSLRTKDDTTREASLRLFKEAPTLEKLLQIEESTLQRLIYPVGFYRNKAKVLRGIARDLINDYGGKIPDELEDLLKLKGVGRKTANLVITLGYGKLGICVDTHVHRISNRLGYVQTGRPEETELALRDKLPIQYWIVYNDLLVSYGQNICRPTSPFCTRCRLTPYCDKKDVSRSR